MAPRRMGACADAESRPAPIRGGHLEPDTWVGSRVRVACQGAETGEIARTHLLIAAGRTPNTDTLGLEHLNLNPDPRGFLPVDDRLRTTVEDVWALGDIRGGPSLCDRVA